ncbi:MAG: HlyC/CorC family transporter [Verrucomicrobia bacterium]|nr:HlyC/CorC family transporter [Verrucomicrobiota bacterium]MBI3870396.1 HlyC/CorC family transporter [Verrucomicrobiota bacterium]
MGLLALKLFAVALLVLLNGFFVAAEFALVKVRDSQLRPLVLKGHRRARIAQLILGNLDSSLSACQLGITLASLGLGWIGEPVFEALLQPAMDLIGMTAANLGPTAARLRHFLAVVTGFGSLTFLHIVVGEQAPKWLAIQRPLPTALWVVEPLRWFHVVSYPFIWVLNHSSLWFLRQAGLQPQSESESSHSDDELRILFAEAHKQRGATALGRAIVMNALDLKDRIAREVMRPRSEIAAMSADSSIAECLELAEKTRFSRFPLCEEGDLDRTIGVLHIKDLYSLRNQAASARDLRRASRKLVYIPETARLETVLQIFLDRKLHCAIVVDEYGGTVGLLTLENILEELVGQIQDEFDLEKPTVVQLGKDHWEIQGLLPLHELAELVGESLDAEDVTTASGWVTQRLGGFPRRGDVVRIGLFELRVDEADGRLVSKLTLQRAARTEPVPPSRS